MKKGVIYLTALLLVGAAIYSWKLMKDDQEKAPPPPPLTTAPSPSPVANSPDHFPVPSESSQKPEPANIGPDAVIIDSTVTSGTLEKLFGLESFARKVVITIKSLNNSQTFQTEFLPAEPPTGELLTSGDGNDLELSSANYDRYTQIVNWAGTVDLEFAIKLYVAHYALFQKAYEDTGYKDYFNDLLVRTIGSILKVRQPKGKIRLIRLSKTLKFEDPQLEDLPAGQKILIRMGPANSAKVKTILRALRDQLTHLNLEN